MELRALLVDDEINIVRNLQKVIPWEELGFVSVETASNGLRALDAVEKEEPDLILCDIRMPMMDGVTFLKELRKQHKDCQVVMLTGYQDFEYMRTSLQHGARDYIMKPFHYDELERVIGNIASEIRSRKAQLVQDKKRWNRAVSLAYEKFLFDVLSDYTSLTTKHFMFDDDNKLDELEYTLILADLDNYSQLSRHWNEKERKLKNFAVRNVLQDALIEQDARYAVLQMREGEWCLVVQHPIGEAAIDHPTLIKWSEKLQSAVRENVKLPLSVGVLSERVPIAELATGYKKLQRTMHLTSSMQRVIIAQDDLESNPLNTSIWGLMEEIVSSVKQQEREKMERAFSELKESLGTLAGQSVSRAEQLLQFLVLHLLRELREINLLPDTEEQAVWSVLERSITVKSLLEVIHKLISDALLAGTSRKPSDILMVTAKDYILRNLASDFGVDEISDHLGISCSYFSLLFKQHYGETFLEFLTRHRIELAKSLLLSGDKSVSQVGKMAGYAERRYFTRVFYKFTGMTPTEYRDRKNGSADPID